MEKVVTIIKNNTLFIYSILMVLYLEFLFKAFVFHNPFTHITYSYVAFSFFYGILISLLCSLFGKKANKVILFIITLILTFIFIAQMINNAFYGNIISIYSLFNGGQVFGFFTAIVNKMINNIGYVLLSIVPLISLIALNKFIVTKKENYKNILVIFGSLVIIYLFSIIPINIDKSKNSYSAKKLYYDIHYPILTVKEFGLITEMRLDLKRFIFGFEEKVKTNTSNASPLSDITKEEEITEKYNITNINFDELIQNETDSNVINMHNYFKNISPTNQNKYTGLFEGKNLIVITAEAFSPIAIDKNLTPTLYKMYTEGMTFSNFYTPLFYNSTSDGEYTSLLSVLPKEAIWSMSKSSNNYLPYAYGNIFKTLNYTTRAYHNGESDYYDRHLSHPNMGYIYKACYKGLSIVCNQWPQSDLEMIEASSPEYINDEKFMTYYMTVSGHLEYNFGGNKMSYKHYNEVQSLPYSDAIKAYIACHIELDKALEKLLSMLKEKGILDDTVITISADHYPYGLTLNQMKEVSSYIKDDKLDIHKNEFIIYNSGTQPLVTNKYASSLDILPTMLNLFGIEYDSRLLIGSDLFSSREGLVIFNDRSWITDSAKYNALTNTYTTFKDNISETYKEDMNNLLYNKFLMSKLILEKDYYRKVFK